MTVGTVRRSMPPVRIWARPSAAPSDPSVTISGGILALAIRTPLSSPHARPDSTATRMPTLATPQPCPPEPSSGPIAIITFAATTPEKTSTEPIDRSMPAVTITNVMPTPSTARIAAFWAICLAFSRLPKLLGASVTKTAMISASTSRIWNAWSRSTRPRTVVLSSSGTATPADSFTGTLMPRLPSLRSSRRPAVPCSSPRSGTSRPSCPCAAPVPGRKRPSRAASSG